MKLKSLLTRAKKLDQRALQMLKGGGKKTISARKKLKLLRQKLIYTYLQLKTQKKYAHKK